jgi:DNA-directed RNA polymerase specialized sigma24 family protein
MDDDLPTLGDLIGYNPWEEVDRQLDIEMALDKIHPLYREALILWGQGYTYTYIAKQMNISRRSAKRYAMRGYEALRARLDA